MRLGGRLAAASEVLDDIGRRHRPAGEALKDWGLSHRFAGAGDRAAIGNIVHDALRRRRSAAFLLDDEAPLSLALGALMLEDDIGADGLFAALAGDRFAPPLPAAAVLAAAEVRKVTRAPDGVRADCPGWCEPLLARAFDAAWVEEGAALAARPPLDLRANTLKADRARVLAALAGTDAAVCRLAPCGIRIAPTRGPGRHAHVQAEPAFRKGWFEVQDEGSQAVSHLAGAAPGMQVLDFCAGAGGKTLALSASMENRGQLFAHDADKQRLAPIFERLKRAGCRNVQAVAERAELAPLEGRMDVVLVDAPCTGSGTWRRRPDAKWRLTPGQLQARQAEQDAILDEAVRFVKPGGRLAYVTCSVFTEENADRVAAFLQRTPGFAAADHAALWARHFPGHAGTARISAHGLSLTPALSGTDGFFLAMLERASGE